MADEDMGRSVTTTTALMLMPTTVRIGKSIWLLLHTYEMSA